jgi:hypothetical protein
MLRSRTPDPGPRSGRFQHHGCAARLPTTELRPSRPHSRLPVGGQMSSRFTSSTIWLGRPVCSTASTSAQSSTDHPVAVGGTALRTVVPLSKTLIARLLSAEASIGPRKRTRTKLPVPGCAHQSARTLPARAADWPSKIRRAAVVRVIQGLTS